MTLVKSWDETNPAGSRLLSLGDDDIRDFKYAIRERLAVDHRAYSNESGETNVGCHNKASLIEQASDPASLADAMILYAKLTGSYAELYLRHENAGVIQLTALGLIRADNFTRLANIPSGAGIIPIANLASGTPDGTKFIRDDGTLAVALQTMPAGTIIQCLQAQDSGYRVFSGFTAIPCDNTTPQISEGYHYTQLDVSITPTSATNKIRVRAHIHASANGYGNGWAPICFLFNNLGTDALAGSYASVIGGSVSYGHSSHLGFEYVMTAGTTSAINFQVNLGDNGNSTSVIVGGFQDYFNGSVLSSLTVEEIKV